MSYITIATQEKRIVMPAGFYIATTSVILGLKGALVKTLHISKIE